MSAGLIHAALHGHAAAACESSERHRSRGRLLLPRWHCHGLATGAPMGSHAVGRLIPDPRGRISEVFLSYHDFLKKINYFRRKIKRERLICDRFRWPNRAYLPNI